MKTIIDDSELEGLTDSIDLSNEMVRPQVTIQKGQGPSEGNGRGKEIDELTKELIVLDANTSDLTQKELAEIHGVSQTTISHLSMGKRGTGNVIPDPELVKIAATARENIQTIAENKLLATLDRFSPEGLSDQMEIVNAASKMAGIVQRITPSERWSNKEDKPKVQIIMVNPRQHKEESYVTIEV